MLILLLACTPDPAPPPGDTGEIADTSGTDSETAGETADDTAGDTEADTAPDTAPAYVWDPPPEDTGPFPTADAPFVVESCGFDNGSHALVLLDDRDGDDVEELLVLGYMTPDDESGAWVVSSSVTGGAFWDQPLGWRRATTWGWSRVTDVDGDGLEEVFVLEGPEQGIPLLPDGTFGEAHADLPVAAIPWHDVDGDGVDEVIGGWMDGLRVVSPGSITSTGWPALIDVARDVDEYAMYGWSLTVTTMDADGDGWPEVIAHGGDSDAWLLSSAAIDAGATWDGATLAEWRNVGWSEPTALGDLDGGGDEDFVFTGSSSLWWVQGESTASPVRVTDGDVADAEAQVVGPDGAGGLALWQAQDGTVRLLVLADLVGGTVTELRASALGLQVTDLVRRRDTVWALADDGLAWLPETAAVRLDPASLAATATVEGGGFGGEAEGYGLADVDWDGKLDWWQFDRSLWRAPLAPGTAVSLCDVRVDAGDGWSGVLPIDDVDDDGIPEWVGWAEPETVGLWNPDVGQIANVTFDGYTGTLGCDLDGDGPQEVYVSALGSSWITDPLDWAEGRTPWGVELAMNPTCVGDLDGDGISEVTDRYTSIHVHDGAAAVAGSAVILTEITALAPAGVAPLGDTDGDGLPDFAFHSNDGTCVVTAAEALSDPTLPIASLAHCLEGRSWFRPADIDGDGLAEILLSDGAGGLLAWSIDTDTTETVWTPAESETLLDVVADAFGPGRAAIVLGPDPIVIYAL